ncbi:hypothetical protein AKO1_007088 [Acrasis kona]|uniref:Uncharacterized protein n=1 Tax=Acrasis kona TaxID=1008807 RepID=A0AAW2YT35_9EUKA
MKFTIVLALLFTLAFVTASTSDVPTFTTTAASANPTTHSNTELLQESQVPTQTIKNQPNVGYKIINIEAESSDTTHLFAGSIVLFSVALFILL